MRKSRALPSFCGRSELLGPGAVALEKRTCDGAGSSARHRAMVDSDDRHDLARGAREERLVGFEQVFVSEYLLANRNVELAPNLEQELARNAREQAGGERGRPHGPALHDEKVG